MKIATYCRSLSGRVLTFPVFVAAAMCTGFVLFSLPAAAQEATPNQQPAEAHSEMPPMRAPVTPLADLVSEAESNNPEIAAAYHGWQAATQVPKQVSALPETQVSVQQFSVGSPRPFAGFGNSDFAYVGIGASQELPWPGKRRLHGKVASLEAESLREDTDAVRRRVVEQVKLFYFRLAYVQEATRILQRNDQLLGQILEVVQARYSVGQGNQQDVLRAQLQHTKILQDIATNRQEEGQLEAELKQILNRSQMSPDVVAEPLSPRFLVFTDTQLLQFARDKNPDVLARRQVVLGNETQIELAHKDFRPDFMASYMWQHTADQFRDYYMATVGISLPNRGRRKAELAQAEQNRLRAQKQLQAETQRVLSDIKQQYVLARASEERLNIYKGGLIPQANATFRAGLAAYQANRQDFETLLGNFLDVLNFDLQYRSELAAHESALARLERLTGVTLP